jgi:hypothetical protein
MRVLPTSDNNFQEGIFVLDVQFVYWDTSCSYPYCLYNLENYFSMSITFATIVVKHMFGKFKCIRIVPDISTILFTCNFNLASSLAYRLCMWSLLLH